MVSFFSGEWLYDPGDHVYNKAYMGVEIDRWSGGVVWKTVRAIAEEVVNDQRAMREGNPDFGAMVLTKSSLVLFEPMDGEFYVADFDEHGFVQMPSWTWTNIGSAPVREVVGWST